MDIIITILTISILINILICQVLCNQILLKDKYRTLAEQLLENLQDTSSDLTQIK